MLDTLLNLLGLNGRDASLSLPLPQKSAAPETSRIEEVEDSPADPAQGAMHYPESGTGAAPPAPANNAASYADSTAKADSAISEHSGGTNNAASPANADDAPAGATQVNIAQYYARLPDDLTRNALTRLTL